MYEKNTRCFAILAGFLSAGAQDQKQLRRERIQPSYMIALGRAPAESEITYWMGRADANAIADFVKNHKDFIFERCRFPQ